MTSQNTLHSFNLSNPPPSPLPPKFTLTVPSNTDIWHTPSKGSIFTAPIHYTRLSLSSFRTARVTVSGSLSQLYDQGGLLLAFPSFDATPTRWIKLGIERTDTGKGQLSTVACDRYADWSLQTLTDSDSSSLTVEFERKPGSDALGAYWVVEGQRRMVREVTWPLVANEEVDGQIWVGVYAARPSKVKDGLTMEFSQFAIKDEH